MAQPKQRVDLTKFKTSSPNKRTYYERKTSSCKYMKRFMATLNKVKNNEVLKLENEAKKVEDPGEAEAEEPEAPSPPTPTVIRSRATTGVKAKVRFSAPTCGC